MERVRASSSARDDRKLNRDSHPVFQFDNVTSKSDLFSECVIGSMQTWCQRLGGNVTSGSWYLLAALTARQTDREVATLPLADQNCAAYGSRL